MTQSANNRRATPHALVIEGTARRIGASAGTAPRPQTPGFGLLDLAQRQGARAYESLLDDAMRLGTRGLAA